MIFRTLLRALLLPDSETWLEWLIILALRFNPIPAGFKLTLELELELEVEFASLEAGRD
jgi:hypothetical protein